VCDCGLTVWTVAGNLHQHRACACATTVATLYDDGEVT
jgi:hypothetical protein